MLQSLWGFLYFEMLDGNFEKFLLLIQDQLIFFWPLQISRCKIHPHVNCLNSFQNSGNFENYDFKFNWQFCVPYDHTIIVLTWKAL